MSLRRHIAVFDHILVEIVVLDRIETHSNYERDIRYRAIQDRLHWGFRNETSINPWSEETASAKCLHIIAYYYQSANDGAG